MISTFAKNREKTAEVESDFVLLATAEASNNAFIDFTSVITSKFKDYQIRFSNVIPATDDNDFYMRLSADNGSSFIASAYDNVFVFAREVDSAYNMIGRNASAFFRITDGDGFGANRAIGGAAGEFGASGYIDLFDPLKSQTTSIRAAGTFTDAGNNHAIFDSGGTQTGTNVIDAVRFLMQAGNISSGKFNIYGIQP